MNEENPPWVLKFISGKYQGGEFTLEEGREYVVGRSSECDMVLVEDMISRAHATFSVKDGKVYLRDNGSTNGSFVNGERITEVELGPNDRVLLGTSIIKLLPFGESESTSPAAPPLPEKQSNDPPAETQQNPRARTTVAGMMSGLLEEVPLPDLLQLFSTSRKTGVLRIQGRREARIFLKEGRSVYAEFIEAPGLNPLKVAYRMMSWTEGMFILEPWEDMEFPSEIEMSTEGMMMEAMRVLDELANTRVDIELGQTLTVPTPLESPLSDLDEEKLDAFQAALNYGSVEIALCAVESEEVPTLRALNRLVNNDYLIVS